MPNRARNKPISEYIHQGDLLIQADDTAIANGFEWQLVPAMRQRHDEKFAKLKQLQSHADEVAPHYDLKVKEKNRFKRAALDALMKLRLYLQNAFYDDAEALCHRLLLDLHAPLDEQDLSKYLDSVQDALTKHDHATYPIPASFTQALADATKDFARTLLEVTDLLEDRRTAVQERDIALTEYVKLLTPIRNWLRKMLPQERKDTRLIDYGFKLFPVRRKKKSEKATEEE